MIKMFSIIYQLFFIPHLFVFYKSKNRTEIIEDLYCISLKPDSKFKIASDLTKALSQNKYFRTLFYFRTRGFLTNILRVIYPRDHRFTIDMYTEIDGGVILAHPYSSIINAQRVGKNLYINQLVTIGEKNGKKPVIGDNVKLHTNCIVIGGIVIGDNCEIGAGSVVVKDIPANSIVVGNPARIIKKVKR